MSDVEPFLPVGQVLGGALRQLDRLNTTLLRFLMDASAASFFAAANSLAFLVSRLVA